MQTNLHRVSEFAITAKRTDNDNLVIPEARTAIKRFREHDSDTESEVDDIVNCSNLSTTVTDFSSQTSVSPFNLWPDAPKHESPEDTRVFLSFDWENEVPYERAVER